MELEYGDAARTGLEDNSASLVSLSLVVHELSTEGRRSVRSQSSITWRSSGAILTFSYEYHEVVGKAVEYAYVDNGINLSGVRYEMSLPLARLPLYAARFPLNQ